MDKGSETVELKLVDEKGVTYYIKVSPEDAARANDDIIFATELLNMHLAREKECEPSASILTEDENDIFKWSHEATLLLIEEYCLKEKHFTSGKMTHKKIWSNIATVLFAKGYHVTGPQCLSKYNGMKRTYKSIKDHNAKSGNNPRSWPYMDIMESLLGERPFMSPLAIASSSVTCSDKNNLSNANSCVNSNPCKRKIQDSETNNLSSANSHADLNSKPRKRKIEENALKISESIIESRMLAEKNREQRHKEKMEFKKDMLGFMQKLLDKL